jgi:hypothetical protein
MMEAVMLLRLAGAFGAAGILLITLSAAPAGATTNTITMGPATLAARVLVEVPVTVVCDPLAGASPSDTFDTSVNVTVTQASGQAIANGQGGVETVTPQPLVLTCDGVTQNHVVVQVFPGPGSPRFKGGSAIINASWFFFDETTQVGQGGSTGNVVAKIKG